MRKSTLRVQGSLSFLLSGTGICVVLACMWYWMYVVLTWVWYWHVCGTIMCVALACVWYWQRAGMRFGRMRAIMQKCAAVSPPTPTSRYPGSSHSYPGTTSTSRSHSYPEVPVGKWWSRSNNLKSQRQGNTQGNTRCRNVQSVSFLLLPFSSYSIFPFPSSSLSDILQPVILEVVGRPSA